MEIVATVMESGPWKEEDGKPNKDVLEVLISNEGDEDDSEVSYLIMNLFMPNLSDLRRKFSKLSRFRIIIIPENSPPKIPENDGVSGVL